MTTMTAFCLTAWGREGELVEIPRPAPGPRDVLLKVGGAGACHSDLHLTHDMEPAHGPWAPGFALGHENAGWVEEVGAEVRRFREGDSVAVMGAWGCGACDRCAVGNDPYCDTPGLTDAPGGAGGAVGASGRIPAFAGFGLDGGMAEFMVVRDADRHSSSCPTACHPTSRPR